MPDTKSRPATIPFLSPATISPSCEARSRCSSTVPLPGLHCGTGMEWQLASGSTTGTASAFTQFMRVRGATIGVTGVFTQKRFYRRSPYTKETLHRRAFTHRTVCTQEDPRPRQKLLGSPCSRCNLPGDAALDSPSDVPNLSKEMQPPSASCQSLVTSVNSGKHMQKKHLFSVILLGIFSAHVCPTFLR